MDMIFADTRFDYVHFGNHEGVPASGVEMRSSTVPTRWRIVVWFVPNASHKVSGTITVPPVTGPIYRWIFKDCKAVTWDNEFSSDEFLKGTLNFELSSTDGSGAANIYKEYTASQGTTALTVPTTSHGGTYTWNTTTPAFTGSYRS